jgi:DNA-binding transcriptional LysR family regulator
VNVTLKHLQAFVAVAQEGSFTRAARRLALSQPALTIQITQFEEELGVRLFDRTTRRVLLTDNGAEFLPTAERLLDDVHSAIAEVRDVAARRRGRVGVATLPSIAVKLMPAMVAAFRTDYPGVSVHLLDANASGVQERVRRKEVDFGLASQWQRDEDLKFEPVMRDPFRVVCRRDHPLAAKEGPLSWADLAGHEFLGLAPDTGIRPLIEGVADLPSNVRTPPVEVSNIATLDGMLAAGLGVSVLPELALPADPSGCLISRALHGPALSRELCLITRRGRSLSPAAQSLRDLILSRLGNGPVAHQGG